MNKILVIADKNKFWTAAWSQHCNTLLKMAPVLIFCSYCPACTSTRKPCGRHDESHHPRTRRGIAAKSTTVPSRRGFTVLHGLQATEHITFYPTTAASSNTTAAASSNPVDELVTHEGQPIRGIRKRRRRWNRLELAVLEAMFGHDPYPGTTEREIVAHRLQVTPRAVQVWLQNARARCRRREAVAAAASAVRVAGVSNMK